MTNKQLLEMLDQAELITNELNSLDYSKAEDDAVFMDNINRLEQMHQELSGKPQMVKPQTTKYLQ